MPWQGGQISCSLLKIPKNHRTDKSKSDPTELPEIQVGLTSVPEN
jgi:hypothetical protein